MIDSTTGSTAADLEAMLAPISADRPAGVSLRYDEVYDRIKTLREEDDPSLPQGVWQRELKKASWDEVAEIATEALETRTKDLQIAGWLLEAWLHLDGLAGVERGLDLLAGLCESFWPSVHPQIEDGELEFRLAPLRWVGDRTAFAIQSVAITDPETDDAPVYTWLDWESGLYLANLARTDADAAREEEARGRVTQEKVLVSVSLTPTGFYVVTRDRLDRVERALERLEGILAERMAAEAAPSFSPLREVMAKIRRFVDSILEQRHRAEPARPPAAAAAAGEEDETLAPLASDGRVGSRAEAYRQLAAAAEYLLRTEPHSPTPYLVKRAVSWGNLTLAELLRELLEDNADLRTVYKLLGIKEIERRSET